MNSTTIAEYPNINIGLPALLQTINLQGKKTGSRNGETLEVSPYVFSILNPLDRCLVLPKRNNDIFLTVAETMWVLAGRNDVEFLNHYLKRAACYSDDGKVWRGAYGPRLVNWDGINQLEEVFSLLKDDRTSRRAVISLFDPSKDFTQSNDIPCNNWIHFLIREDQLDMRVAIRSSDVIWGLSGINIFEWSIVLEVMAFWLNIKPGVLTFFISSLHLYKDHYEKARDIINNAPSNNIYDLPIVSPRFNTPINNFKDTISQWFLAEEHIRSGKEFDISTFPDPLFRVFLEVVAIKWCTNEVNKAYYLNSLSGSDYGIAAIEYLEREKNPDFITKLLASCRQSISLDSLKRPIVELHRRKNNDYGTSWKRRGEAGVLANIARKVDRINNSLNIELKTEETLFETILDLLVYSLKYKTFLFDKEEGSQVAQSEIGLSGPYSDDPFAFDILLNSLTIKPVEGEIKSISKELNTALDSIYNENGVAVGSFDRSLIAANRLIEISANLLLIYYDKHPCEASTVVNKYSSTLEEK